VRLEPILTPFNIDRGLISWSSSNEEVATVSDEGVVTGGRIGTAVITASDPTGEIAANTTITVRQDQRPVRSIAMSSRTLSLAVGQTSALTVTFTPSNATMRGITWSSDNSAIATVDASGRVSGHAPGTAVISAVSDSGQRVATSTVTVRIPVTSLTLEETTFTLRVGQRVQLVPIVGPTDATNQNATYASRNTNIASVTSTGSVLGRRVGTTTVTVTVDGRTTVATIRVVR
jgi:uncharacterized protein YjdB